MAANENNQSTFLEFDRSEFRSVSKEVFGVH